MDEVVYIHNSSSLVNIPSFGSSQTKVGGPSTQTVSRSVVPGATEVRTTNSVLRICRHFGRP